MALAAVVVKTGGDATKLSAGAVGAGVVATVRGARKTAGVSASRGVDRTR